MGHTETQIRQDGIATVTLVKRVLTKSQYLSEELGDVDFHLERLPHLRMLMLSAVKKYFAYPLAEVRVTVPATWWQAFKQALKRRWPRLFGRLYVRATVHSLKAEDAFPDYPMPETLGRRARVLAWDREAWD